MFRGDYKSSIPYSFNSLQWRHTQTQSAHLIATRVAPLCWRVYPRDHSRNPAGVRKYCAYLWFTRLRHCTDLRWIGYTLLWNLRQYHGWCPVLQRPLRNKLKATERYLNRSRWYLFRRGRGKTGNHQQQRYCSTSILCSISIQSIQNKQEINMGQI